MKNSALVLCMLLIGAGAPSTKAEEGKKPGFRLQIPKVPRSEAKRLRDIQGEFNGRRLDYRVTENSGRTIADAIIIDSFNSLSGMNASRHLLTQRFPGATFSWVRHFKSKSKHFHEWRVVEGAGAKFSVFIDATYWHDLF